MSFDLSRTQNPFGGGGFLADPFLELAAGVTTPAIPKSNKFDPCVSNGALAGSIIGTLIMCTFIGFLTWLIYIRPKLRELHYMHLYESRRIANRQHLHSIPSSANSNHKQQSKRQYHDDDEDNSAVQLPIDVTDCKFGTFPFRQSQTASVNGHYNRVDWLNRISCSFRSVNMEKDSETLDIPLLDPTFSGLNFSITGNMRAGIFVKEIIDKGAPPQGIIKPKSSDQLKTGDRIMALTVCFESIVYEDALTILSYASPYPVILRVQRPSHHTKVNETSEKRPPTVNTTNKVKWQDDFEHYDNDTSQQSIVQPNSPVPVNNLPPIPTNSKVLASPKKHSPSKKTRPNNNATTTTQSRVNSRASSANKGNKIKASPNSATAATSGTTTKRSNSDVKKHRPKANTTNSNNNNNSQRSIANQMMLMSTGLTAKPAANTKAPPIPTSTKPIKSVTDSAISYRHYNKGGDGEGVARSKDKPNKSEASMMPYYDSPYDYYYGNVSQYQYLHQSHLNKNNNNSHSTESLTAITPNLAASIYTIKLSSTKSCVGIHRRRERCLSSPAVLATAVLDNNTAIDVDEKLDSVDNSDSFV